MVTLVSRGLSRLLGTCHRRDKTKSSNGLEESHGNLVLGVKPACFPFITRKVESLFVLG
jgi:hypothetical protein